ncbi:hypothetical protein FOTG_16218 [Fusarium oxysporum f. sp. vasinfectum 25433]|uniref:HAT C-terminal dimerisation domain-containing protein n=1 Tax=Fusarium oxysporum f. sp. vasinfectum 25433 TaxID=1089449 RepID=X0KP99_FUSOX|nr:hypothetical protein FOTG_16218 [Fusarium oxysporum f. sp. vasinfectum 25433]
MGQEDDQYTQWINSKTKKAFATGGSVGELERNLCLEPQDTQDAIQWRRDHRASFPSLSSFALDVFAIPAMASDCETIQPSEADVDFSEALDGRRYIGTCSIPQELGQAGLSKVP